MSDMATKKLTCEAARQIDLVDFLSCLGHDPVRIRNHDYWYLSPLREEKTASFKINRQANVWFDHGTGEGGNLIDFGIQYFRCPVSELLNRLSEMQLGNTFSFHLPSHTPTNSTSLAAGEKEKNGDSKIVVLEHRPLADLSLLDYLKSRSIPKEIAGRFCREVYFLLYGKQHTAIGFPNRSGGFELRNSYFKGSSSPKDVTLIDNRTKELAVFEGFFNFLSFRTVNRNLKGQISSSLVLNSLAFFGKRRPLMEQYQQVFLLLDRDKSGMTATQKALEWDAGKYFDRSDFYRHKKDLNEWLVSHTQSPKTCLKAGKRF
jgi:hypothetical protein